MAVEFDHVSRQFDGVTALDNVTFSVPDDSIVGVVGTSGAGKSTLLRTVNGLETPTGGTVTTLGVEPATLGAGELRGLRREVGMIFQQYNLLGSKTVAENVAMPLTLEGTRDARRVNDALELVGLGDKADAKPQELSGGQRQRVGIARALVTRPRLLLCDEPTSALDPMTTGQILDLLTQINEQLGITVLIITHQMNVIARIADNVAVLEHGKLIETGPVEDVFSSPQQELTREFVATTVPRADADSDTERLIRVHHRDGAARSLFDKLAHLGVRASLLQANDLPLRSTTVGSMLIGLDNPGADQAIALISHTDGLSVEVIR
ncbi:methionine ABC transporter ATP-binding protein [Corynebacterium glucuronolyticum]|uniref:methionine ABC transporter ATP-binding protein n=1 Tax=Corynebacterium glucuronolyticum TaxID=39791 RepID=UPI003F6DEB6D